ncbi:hypothetical protein EYF80_017093 [Liparis tanakae]|uniref:Uncharacterized protein n=1 Tax=Liparis tanakae TaxID=230148 RepID=A0A4Z2I5Q8_9TELE|nr:hypothetical protein EYF80_017093 [Liparis tanakae]
MFQILLHSVVQRSAAPHGHGHQGPVVSFKDLRDGVPYASWEPVIILRVQFFAQTGNQGPSAVGARRGEGLHPAGESMTVHLPKRKAGLIAVSLQQRACSGDPQSNQSSRTRSHQTGLVDEGLGGDCRVLLLVQTGILAGPSNIMTAAVSDSVPHSGTLLLPPIPESVDGTSLTPADGSIT